MAHDIVVVVVVVVVVVERPFDRPCLDVVLQPERVVVVTWLRPMPRGKRVVLWAMMTLGKEVE